MFITLINDCCDANAQTRQEIKISNLFGVSPIFCGVSSDIEAAGNLIDSLDASKKEEGIVLLNVAPRNGNAKKWPNGTPFGYFYYGKTLVLSSIGGCSLSLIKKLKITDAIKIINLDKSVEKLKNQKIIKTSEAEKIKNTQFRSLEFLPLAAYAIFNNKKISFEEKKLDFVPEINKQIWWVDNFGNCKTSILENEINSQTLSEIKRKIPGIEYIKRLKDVGDEKTALIIGSSGLDGKKFAEIIIQGGNASKKYNLKSGWFLS